MRETLASEVESFLRAHGAKTATEIAIGVRARRDDVDEVLASGTFRRVPAPDGCSPRAVYFSLSYLVPSRSARVVSRADRMFEVLRDGQPHSREEIFERVGFMLTNNAAAELRERGYEIESWQERRIFIYQLVGLDEAAATEPSPSASSPAQSVAASSSPHEPEAA